MYLHLKWLFWESYTGFSIPSWCILCHSLLLHVWAHYNGNYSHGEASQGFATPQVVNWHQQINKLQHDCCISSLLPVLDPKTEKN